MLDNEFLISFSVMNFCKAPFCHFFLSIFRETWRKDLYLAVPADVLKETWIMSEKFVDVTRFIAFQFVRQYRKTRRINQQVAEFSHFQYSHNVSVMVIFHFFLDVFWNRIVYYR